MNSKKIMIVEDEEKIVAQLKSIASEVNPDLEIMTTGFGEEALSYSSENEISAFFLDIQLEDFSGLHLARELRKDKRYEFVPIVFITAMPTRELEAFRQIHCYDYIVKPFLKDEIKEMFQKILVNYMSGRTEEKEETVMLRFRSYTQLVNQSDILFVEYRNRKIVVHTKLEAIEYIHVPLKKFKDELTDDFVQIHQSILVNKTYIGKINLKMQQIELSVGQHQLPIGRSYQNKIRGLMDEL